MASFGLHSETVAVRVQKLR